MLIGLGITKYKTTPLYICLKIFFALFQECLCEIVGNFGGEF